MANTTPKKRLFSLLLAFTYLLNSGCAMSSEESKSKKEDSDSQKLHEWHISKMDRYKENSFIKDFEIYNDAYPEFYINKDGETAFGVLTEDFASLTGGHPFSTDHYYIGLMDKYESKQYKVDENGNLIFNRTGEDCIGNLETTIFSSTKDEKGKSFTLKDQKDGETVIIRNIFDSGSQLQNEITIKRVLSEDVTATINAVHKKFPMFENTDIDMYTDTVTTVITINYYGEIYNFISNYAKNINGYSRTISLPSEIVSDNSIVDTPTSLSDSESYDVFNTLRELICNDRYYTDGKNPEAIAYFEQFLGIKECLDLFAQGSLDNPWYSYIQELIKSKEYKIAMDMMTSDASNWISNSLLHN